MNTTENGSSVVRSIDRALSIMKCFSTKEPELSLGEISARVGLAKSTVHRILQSLEAGNFIEQNEDDGKYYLSYELIRLGTVASDSIDLKRIAIKEMNWLAETTKQCSNLYLLRGQERLCLVQVQGARYITRYSEVGGMFPLYAGGAGKAILAYQEDEWIHDYLSHTVLEKTAATTPTTKEEVWKNLHEVRKNGWSISYDERSEGACSMALPIRDFTGEVIASITLSGPTAQFPPEKVEEFLPLLQEAAERISKRLGYVG